MKLFLLLAIVALLVLPGQCMHLRNFLEDLVRIAEEPAPTPSPIVLIPGIMGSQLEVQDNGGPSQCATGPDYTDFWIEPWHILWYNLCAERELPLLHDSTGFHNNTKVKMTVPDFGGTSAVESLNPTWIKDTIPYMSATVQYFVDREYERGKSIRAAPYDWRLAADELEKRGYFDQLKSLIEDTYKINGDTKVTIVAHSMGGIMSLYFFTSFKGIDQAWKDHYIHAYVTLSAAWSGGATSVQTVVSGVHGVPNVLLFAYDLISDFLVPAARTLESIPWLFPKPSVYGEDQVLVTTPNGKQYTANDYEELFRDIGAPEIYETFKQDQKLNEGYPAPNVPMYCFYGDKVKTPITFHYDKNFDSHESTIGWLPEITYGPGDGTVNTVSSKVCLKWSGMSHGFTYKAFDNIDHATIVTDDQVLGEIAEIVGAPTVKQGIWDTLWNYVYG